MPAGKPLGVGSFTGQASDYNAAFAHLQKSPANVVFLDLGLRMQGDLSMVKDMSVLANRSSFIILSELSPEIYAQRCINAGARAYLKPQTSEEEIWKAISLTGEGKIYLNGVIKSTINEFDISSANLEEIAKRLSPREMDIFWLCSQGRSTKDIASELGISGKTVESYFAHLREKLNIHNVGSVRYHAMRLHYENSKDWQFDPTILGSLSNRQLEIALLLGQGFVDSKDLGSKLSVDFKTIDAHFDHLKKKLNCPSKIELINLLIKANIHISNYQNGHIDTPVSEDVKELDG